MSPDDPTPGDPPSQRPTATPLEAGRSPAESSGGPAGGRPADYLVLFVAMQGVIQAYLRSMLPRHADAEDAFQETFLIVRAHLDHFDVTRDFGHWVRGIARNVARRICRQHSKDRNRQLDLGKDLSALLIDATSDIESDRDEATARHRSGVRSWLSSLGADQQRMVVMRYVDRLPVESIASQLGKRETAIYMALSRLRSSLLAHLDHCRRAEPAAEASAAGTPLAIDLPPSAADPAVDTANALRLLVTGIARGPTKSPGQVDPPGPDARSVETGTDMDGWPDSAGSSSPRGVT